MLPNGDQQLSQVSTLLSVSVAMATYNGERYIRDQLDSIAGQSVLPLEIVITDDGSTDRTAEIIEEFAATVSFPVRFYRNETRLRYADNFLRAAGLCQGELIAFCDQDDLWKPNKLAACCAPFSDPGVVLVLHAAETFTAMSQQGYRFPNITRNETLKHGKCDQFENQPAFAMLYRKELLSLVESSRRFATLYSHDHWIWFLATSVGNVVKLKEDLVLYRQHENNVYGATEVRSLINKLKIGAEIPSYADVAFAERACAQTLFNALPTVPSHWRKQIGQSAKALVLRSELHRIRVALYRSDRDFFSRVRVFCLILIMGGYFPNKARTLLGPRAGIKDILWGVFGLSKVYESLGRQST